MSNLISSMLTAAGALDAYSQALDVVQNNVANASTPGYASQTQLLDACGSTPRTGLPAAWWPARSRVPAMNTPSRRCSSRPRFWAKRSRM